MTMIFRKGCAPFLPIYLLLAIAAGAQVSTNRPADRVYRNGVIFTADAQNRTAEALAIRGGQIVYVGRNQGVAPFVGAATVTVDLKGRFLMPGLIDGHMHPLEAGLELLKCNLNYESLTVAELQHRVQACLDRETTKDPNAWLEVVNWFQESMRPPGVKTSRATLDVLKTKRPIIVRSSFGHTVLANTRALELAKITTKTPDPAGGKIWRDTAGEPTGLLEDAAFNVFSTLLPKPTAADGIAGAGRTPGHEPPGRDELLGCRGAARGHRCVSAATTGRQANSAFALCAAHSTV